MIWTRDGPPISSRLTAAQPNSRLQPMPLINNDWRQPDAAAGVPPAGCTVVRVPGMVVAGHRPARRARLRRAVPGGTQRGAGRGHGAGGAGRARHGWPSAGTSTAGRGRDGLDAGRSVSGPLIGVHPVGAGVRGDRVVVGAVRNGAGTLATGSDGRSGGCPAGRHTRNRRRGGRHLRTGQRVGLIANALVGPLVGPAAVLGFIAAGLSLVSPAAASSRAGGLPGARRASSGWPTPGPPYPEHPGAGPQIHARWLC